MTIIIIKRTQKTAHMHRRPSNDKNMEYRVRVAPYVEFPRIHTFWDLSLFRSSPGQLSPTSNHVAQNRIKEDGQDNQSHLINIRRKRQETPLDKVVPHAYIPEAVDAEEQRRMRDWCKRR